MLRIEKDFKGSDDLYYVPVEKSKFKQILIKTYAMESFLYREVNKMMRTEDDSKHPTLGPYTFALEQILFCI